MVAIHNASPYGRLQPDELQVLQNSIGVPLPQDYRDFLKQYNGGKPEPCGFWIQEGVDGSGVYQFYRLNDGPDWLSIDDYVDAEQYGTPSSLLVIGDDGVGNYLCVGIKGKERGGVYFIDHEIHYNDMADSFEGITRIAESFSNFLSALQQLS